MCTWRTPKLLGKISLRMKCFEKPIETDEDQPKPFTNANRRRRTRGITVIRRKPNRRLMGKKTLKMMQIWM